MDGLTRKAVLLMEVVMNAESSRASGLGFGAVHERTGMGTYGVKG